MLPCLVQDLSLHVVVVLLTGIVEYASLRIEEEEEKEEEGGVDDCSRACESSLSPVSLTMFASAMVSPSLALPGC